MKNNQQTLSPDLRKKYIDDLVSQKKNVFLKIKSGISVIGDEKQPLIGHIIGGTSALNVLMQIVLLFTIGDSLEMWSDLYRKEGAGVIFMMILSIPIGIWYILYLYSHYIGTTDELKNYQNELHNYSDDLVAQLHSELTENNYKIEAEKKLYKLSRNIITSILIVGAGAFLYAEVKSSEENTVKRLIRNLTSDAECKINSHIAEKSSFLVSDKPDYGISINAEISNKGDKGEVFVEVSVSSSEGELYRAQKIYFQGGETKQLTYQFHEITVNATNIRYSVSCSPRHS